MICSHILRGWGCFAVFAFILLTGCASKPPPFHAPAAALALSHYSGNPVSGPTTKPVENIDPAAVLAVDLRIVALQDDRSGELGPIGPQVRLITADQGGTPVLAAGLLTRACRWASGDAVDAGENRLKTGALGQSAEMTSYKIALPPDVTSTVRVVDGKPESPGTRRIELFLCQTRPAGGSPQLQIALGVVDLPPKSAPPPDQSAPPVPAPSASEPMHELAVLQAMEIRGPASAMILVPFTFKDGKSKSVILTLHATMGASGDEMAKALAICTDDLKASAATLSKTPAAASAASADWPGFEAALNGLRNPSSRRQSLVYLATQANADICEDAALSANDQTLEQLSAAILKQAGDGKLPRESASLGWALDSATLTFISQLQSSSTKAPELLAVLLRHTGQVGDTPGSVDEPIKASSSKKEFDIRVTAENLVFLEDTSPAARVRAFDWLSAHGAAPAGYDPLAPALQRQTALQRAMDSAATKPAGGRP